MQIILRGPAAVSYTHLVSMDVSTEIDTLEAMLRQDGLTHDFDADFKMCIRDSPKEEPFHNALDDALYTTKVCRKLPLAEGLATYPTEEELLKEALLGAEPNPAARDIRLFMNRMEHDDYRNVSELTEAACPKCSAPLTPDEVWLKRGNTGYYTRCTCPYCGAWYLRFKLSRRDGLHWSFARCTEPATPEADAKWDKQKAALLERMKRKANKE